MPAYSSDHALSIAFHNTSGPNRPKQYEGYEVQASDKNPADRNASNLYNLLNTLFDCACQITGASICIYTYENLFLTTINIDTHSHRCPWCRINIEHNKLLYESNKQPCVYADAIETRDKALSIRTSFIKKCYAGVTEMVIPVFKADELIALIFLGQCRTNDSRISDKLLDDLKRKGVSMNSINKAYNLLPVIDEDTLCNTSTLLENAMRHVVETNSSMFTNRLINTHSYIVETKNIIQNGISRKRKDIAAALRISPEYLSKLFRQHVGMTVVEYIQKTMIEHARMMLINSDLTMADIAEKCGYSDQNYFSRVFRQHLSMSPHKYRKQNTHIGDRNI